MAQGGDQRARVAQRMKERALLLSTSTLLSWDEATGMPRAGARHRAEQQAQLLGLARDLAADPQLGEWLAACSEDFDVRRWKRLHQRASRVPRRLVESLAKTCTLAREAWASARDANDGRVFKSQLARVVALKREESDALANGGDRYEALLDEYEPFVSAATTEGLVEAVAHELLRRATAWECGAPEKLPGPVAEAAQLSLCTMVARAVGFSERRGRIDTGSYGSSVAVGPGDVRVTVRLSKLDATGPVLRLLHELGHWFTDDGAPENSWGTPRGEVASHSLHESQARFFENHLGRSDAFWDWLWPKAKAAWAPHFDASSALALRKHVKWVHRGLMRGWADEVTSDLHVVLRMRLERALISGKLEVDDLPGAWSDASAYWFGTRPKNDLEGWLQDGHWSAGRFGYFPTYTLGNLAAAQFAETLKRERPDCEHEVARGDFSHVVSWLKGRIHTHGGEGNVFERVQAVTGRALTAEAFLRHLDARYGSLRR
ncbi:MAG: hypothetical protein JNJ54_30250 [Myxococcaceae bacterium]|nr:hypothetical protein [Myxococcaceae bacterium]